MASYDHIFTVTAGYVASATYYAQLAHRFSGQMWDEENGVMADAPTYANTDISVTDINSSGRIGFTMPTGVPAGKYQLLLRQRAGGTPANTDNVIAAPVNIRVQHDGKLVKE